MTKRPTPLLGVLSLLLGACTGSSGGSPTSSSQPLVVSTSAAPPTTRAAVTTIGSASPTGTAAADGSGAWSVDASACPDPAAVEAPINDRLQIAVVAPTSGGVAAAAWKSTIDGFKEALSRANFDGDLTGLNLDVIVVDDASDPQRATLGVQSAIDDGAQVVAGVAGDAANLALRFTLNEQCIPQLFGFAATPELGAVEQYPWTMAIEPTTDREVEVAGTLLAGQYPDGGTIGLYTADDERGRAYRRSVTTSAASKQFGVVADEVVPAASAVAAPDAVERLAATRPDVVMAAPSGIDCAYFLRELSIRRNRAPDWRPLVVVDSACASAAVLGLAGPGADGVYSTANLVDPTTDENAALPGVADYTNWMTTRGFAAEIPDAVAGWTAGEALVATVRQAVRSPGGLSRRSIIEAARALDLTPTLGRPRVVLRTDGARDPFPAESAQVVQWVAARRTFSEIGPVVTRFES